MRIFRELLSESEKRRIAASALFSELISMLGQIGWKHMEAFDPSQPGTLLRENWKMHLRPRTTGIIIRRDIDNVYSGSELEQTFVLKDHPEETAYEVMDFIHEADRFIEYVEPIRLAFHDQDGWFESIRKTKTGWSIAAMARVWKSTRASHFMFRCAGVGHPVRLTGAYEEIYKSDYNWQALTGSVEDVAKGLYQPKVSGGPW